MRILWVKAGKLLPVDTGGKIRSYNILRHLARSHQVTLLSYYGGKKDPDYESNAMGEFPGAETIHTAALDGSPLAQYVEYARLLFRPAPFAVSKFTHAEVKRVVSSWMVERKFDVAVCDFLSASLNFPFEMATPAVLFQHNVEGALWQRLATTESNPARKLAYTLEARKMWNYERNALRRFRHVIAVSENDKAQMLAMEPSCSITVVPTGVDTDKYTVAPPAKSDPPKIVFLGSMDWEPNIDAVMYFCREIFAKIRAAIPAAVFQIVGRSPNAAVKQLASEHVEVTGTVPSVNEYLREATVFIVPLRIGGGTRLKIFEAMASGKAVVSTTIGAEGLAVQSGRDLVLADDPETFADATIHLILDSGLRRKYEEAAARLAAQYDWSNIVQQFAAVLDNVRRDTRPGQE
ncbi:MAG TPA: glycosyltransferase family 4 protein [Candidatus Sulfotelmatobacter sp.]|nr:glycosyltransferase family 4 protein [Candidatus Sulfotelmatobacter sp.]